MNFELITKYFTLIGLFIALIGILIANRQIKQTNQLSITNFEDGLARQYREIIQHIPVKALLNEGLAGNDYDVAFNEIYNYIDLTNEQIFLRQQNRIRKETWENWRDGIQSNLSLPTFQRVWKIIKEMAPDYFKEIRRLENEDFKTDPLNWEENISA